MEGTEVRKLAELEDDHWWYRERRHLLAKAISGLVPGRALDIGAAGGGNTRVLREHGWDAVALEYGSAAAEAEVRRVLKPTGTYLVAVPADPKLWSEHDEAVDHVRRYTREGVLDLLDHGGFDVTDVRSWNVLLRPVVAMRRRTSSGSDLENLHPVVNFGLRTIITAERYLPVGGLPGVSLLVRAQPRS